jgi:hypothetical protein
MLYVGGYRGPQLSLESDLLDQYSFCLRERSQNLEPVRGLRVSVEAGHIRPFQIHGLFRMPSLHQTGLEC